MYKTLIFAAVLFLNTVIISQIKTDSYYKTILLSVKTGYHTGYDLKYDRGFPDGLVFDGSIAVGVSKNILLGVNFDYWKRNNYEVNSIFYTEPLSKNFTAQGFRFYVQYRNTFLNRLNLYIDAGLGQYRISYNFWSGSSYNADNNYYLNAGLSLGAGYKFSSHVSLNAEISHYKQLDFDVGGSSSVYTTNIKIGPTFYFKIK